MLRRSIVVPSEVGSARRQLVADEQLIDDELDLLGIQVDVTAPPALETEIAWRFGVDLGIEVVLLGPQRIGGVLVSKFCTSQAPSNLPWPRSLVSAVSQLPPSKPAAVAHGILAAHAGPIGERRARDDDGAEQLRTNRGEHHDRPAGLTIADHAWLAVGLGMQRDHLFEEDRLGARDILDASGPGMGSGRKPMK